MEDWSQGEPSELAAVAESRRLLGLPVLDMVSASPHDHGLVFPQDRLAELVAGILPSIAGYRPDPQGPPAAREAIAHYERGDGAPADPSAIILTAGTSFAYFLAFRLLLDGGGEVLVPRPTYPLFDDLARMAGARTRNYHLRPPGSFRHPSAWSLDPGEVEFQITPSTRAIALVSPHHPTGMVPSAETLRELGRICARRGLALVVDEVFREFMVDPVSRCARPSLAEFGFPLVLTLNGISKMFSLPGWKGGWISATGDRVLVAGTVQAFAYATDAFLPVSDATAALIPRLLGECMDVVATLSGAVRSRQEALARGLEGEGFPATRPDGGVHRVVPLPPDYPADWAVRALHSTGWLVHPGALYGIDDPSFVVSCVREPSDYPHFASSLMHTPMRAPG